MNFNIEISKDGFDILKINRNGKDIYLGSKYNQKREIDKFIASFSEFTENDVYIVLGASFLEHIKALVEKNSLYKKIAILELDTELREYINRESRYNDILRDKRIEFVSSIDEIKSFFVRYINDFNINFVKIGYYANYDKIYGRELVEIMQYIKDISYSILSNKNTNIYFGETWFNTLIDNLEDMKSAVPVNELRNIHKGKAAIIVSAGPSLEKNIDMLKNNKDMLVLSGGRTLKTLTEKNINIDYLGVVDAGHWSFELVKGNIETTKVPLVFYNGTNRDVVRLHSGKKIFCSDNKFINDIFDRDINHIGGGGSVAHFLTNFAIYTGCNPIIFIGQDLAYTNELLHTDICKTPGVQTNVASNFNNVYVDDINGNKIRTSIILNDFRLILENIISENKDIEFINATEGGANIKGTEIITLEECMKKYDVLTLGGSCIEDLIEIKVPEGEQFKKKIKKYIDILSDIVNSTTKGLKEVEELSKTLLKSNSSKRNRILSNLNDVDNLISEKLSKISILQNKIFANMYEVQNSPEYVVNINDSLKEREHKNIKKNKAIYLSLNTHASEAKLKLENLLKE